VADIFARIEGLHLAPRQKAILLLREGMTVERALAAMTGSAIDVKVVRQGRRKDDTTVIDREALLLRRDRGRTLVRAKSEIYCSVLPEQAVRQIERKEKGIGSIIESCNLETCREITDVGRNPDGHPYRRYDILLHKGRVAFMIREEILF
jgi:chorismate-pyruvate lyase